MSIRLRRCPRPAEPAGSTADSRAAAPRAWLRLRASAGVAGPAAFTAAWVTSSLLQTGHSAGEVQISGLAAPDARYPWIMISGFVVLGGCSVVFGSALHEALGGAGRAGPAPRLIQVAGLLTVAAGLLRRDQMLLTAPAGESWHNRAHDVISIPVYLAVIAIPLLLAWRLRGDREFRALPVPLAASAVTSAAVLGLFASAAIPAWDATAQRVAVTLPLAATAAVALRLSTRGLSTRGLSTRGLSTRGLSTRGPVNPRPGNPRPGNPRPGNVLLRIRRPAIVAPWRLGRRSCRSRGGRLRSATRTRSTSRELGIQSSTWSGTT